MPTEKGQPVPWLPYRGSVGQASLCGLAWASVPCHTSQREPGWSLRILPGTGEEQPGRFRRPGRSKGCIARQHGSKWLFVPRVNRGGCGRPRARLRRGEDRCRVSVRRPKETFVRLAISFSPQQSVSLKENILFGKGGGSFISSRGRHSQATLRKHPERTGLCPV